MLRGLRVPEPQDAPDVGDSGHKIYAIEQEGDCTEQQLIGRRRPDKEPAPPNGRGHAHRRPLERRRGTNVHAPSPMQMPMTMMVPRRRV